MLANSKMFFGHWSVSRFPHSKLTPMVNLLLCQTGWNIQQMCLCFVGEFKMSCILTQNGVSKVF